MADIFVSYSKRDRQIAVQLVALLESAGYSVWWDSSLKPPDKFRDEIMERINQARAVVVIWTSASVNSDWVRAESGRARQQRKLLPVRSGDLDLCEIPLPFGELHTEILDNEIAIVEAVEELLSHPVAISPLSNIALAIGKNQLLTWFGILGSAITIFTSLEVVIKLADWSRFLSSVWYHYVAAVWRLIFQFFHVDVPDRWIPLLTLSVFVTSITVGSRMTATAQLPNISARAEQFWQGASFTFLLTFSVAVTSALIYAILNLFVDSHWAFWVSGAFATFYSIWLVWLGHEYVKEKIGIPQFLMSAISVLVVCVVSYMLYEKGSADGFGQEFWLSPLIAIITILLAALGWHAASERGIVWTAFHFAINAWILSVVFTPEQIMFVAEYGAFSLSALLLTLLPLLFCPIDALFRRLTHVSGCVVVLVTLNYISLLDLSVTAPMP